ncbi:Imm27 family immunity protein [Devosia sp. A16]|uniref:Imm27 family immunity protein n=1 Tax=Devosia sp. A16 TaxID=1736675 RepID=UPI0009E69C7D
MSADRPHLADKWIVDGTHVIASGDAGAIDELLANSLEEVASNDGGWRRLYRHRTGGHFWELSYPNSELQGGGPRRLVQLVLRRASDWS